jgi:hypothetical protein
MLRSRLGHGTFMHNHFPSPDYASAVNPLASFFGHGDIEDGVSTGCVQYHHGFDDLVLGGDDARHRAFLCLVP